MENGPKSWLTGCGCGCLSHAIAFVLTYGVCIGASYLLWEVLDVRERFLRGESVLAWGAVVGAGVALLVGVAAVFVVQRMALKRFEKAAAAQPPLQQAGYGGPPHAAPAGAPGLQGAAGAPGMPSPAGAPLHKAGCLMPGIWLGVAAFLTLGGLGAILLGAMDSERAGVAMTWVAAAPLGLGWAGALAALVIHLFIKKAGAGVRVGVPIGCGFLGAIVTFVLVAVFFAVIWPEL